MIVGKQKVPRLVGPIVANVHLVFVLWMQRVDLLWDGWEIHCDSYSGHGSEDSQTSLHKQELLQERADTNKAKFRKKCVDICSSFVNKECKSGCGRNFNNYKRLLEAASKSGPQLHADELPEDERNALVAEGFFDCLQSFGGFVDLELERQGAVQRFVLDILHPPTDADSSGHDVIDDAKGNSSAHRRVASNARRRRPTGQVMMSNVLKDMSAQLGEAIVRGSREVARGTRDAGNAMSSPFSQLPREHAVLHAQLRATNQHQASVEQGFESGAISEEELQKITRNNLARNDRILLALDTLNDVDLSDDPNDDPNDDE